MSISLFPQNPNHVPSAVLVAAMVPTSPARLRAHFTATFTGPYRSGRLQDATRVAAHDQAIHEKMVHHPEQAKKAPDARLAAAAARRDDALFRVRVNRKSPRAKQRMHDAAKVIQRFVRHRLPRWRRRRQREEMKAAAKVNSSRPSSAVRPPVSPRRSLASPRRTSAQPTTLQQPPKVTARRPQSAAPRARASRPATRKLSNQEQGSPRTLQVEVSDGNVDERRSEAGLESPVTPVSAVQVEVHHQSQSQSQSRPTSAPFGSTGTRSSTGGGPDADLARKGALTVHEYSVRVAAARAKSVVVRRRPHASRPVGSKELTPAIPAPPLPRASSPARMAEIASAYGGVGVKKAGDVSPRQQQPTAPGTIYMTHDQFSSWVIQRIQVAKHGPPK